MIAEGEKVAGFDMGSKYVAWSIIQRQCDNLVLLNSGMLYCPPIGETKAFGDLFLFRCLFEQLALVDMREEGVSRWIAERFVHQGMTGHSQSSEEINLRLATMKAAIPSLYMVRNTDWKSWFKRTTSKTTDEFFLTPTPHQADSTGIACFGAAKCFQ